MDTSLLFEEGQRAKEHSIKIRGSNHSDYAPHCFFHRSNIRIGRARPQYSLTHSTVHPISLEKRRRAITERGCPETMRQTLPTPLSGTEHEEGGTADHGIHQTTNGPARPQTAGRESPESEGTSQSRNITDSQSDPFSTKDTGQHRHRVLVVASSSILTQSAPYHPISEHIPFSDRFESASDQSTTTLVITINPPPPFCTATPFLF